MFAERADGVWRTLVARSEKFVANSTGGGSGCGEVTNGHSPQAVENVGEATRGFGGVPVDEKCRNWCTPLPRPPLA
jgi:hypothetical protein